MLPVRVDGCIICKSRNGCNKLSASKVQRMKVWKQDCDFSPGVLVCRKHQRQEHEFYQRVSQAPTFSGQLSEETCSLGVLAMDLSASYIFFGTDSTDSRLTENSVAEGTLSAVTEGEVALNKEVRVRQVRGHVWSALTSRDGVLDWLGEKNIPGLLVYQHLCESGAPESVIGSFFAAMAEMANCQSTIQTPPSGSDCAYKRLINEEMNSLVVYQANRVKANAMFGSRDEIGAFFEFFFEKCPTVSEFFGIATNSKANETERG